MRSFIISYNRAGKMSTTDWNDTATILIRESQREAYEEEQYPNPLLVIPDSEDGNPSKARNAILKRYPGEDVLILDDDIRAVGYFELGAQHEASQAQFYAQAETMFQMCHDMNTSQWGFNVNESRKFYREYSPFSLSSVVLGPVSGIITNDNILYDESIWLKEDYDFWLQKMLKHRRTLRNNKWFYYSPHLTVAGGLSSVRTSDLEKEHAKMFQSKWGSKIVQVKQGDTNPVVRVPIRGI